MKLAWKNYVLDFSERTRIMGILNVTPDSFSDGGRYLESGSAVDRGVRMAAEGADIIDIGGESTRPGARRVPVKEELERIMPVIEELSTRVEIPISVDTCKSAVALAAIGAGASMINDISGLRSDPAMAPLAAERKVPVVIMHMQGTPRTMQKAPRYDALIPEIMEFFHESISIARKAGVRDDMIILDPGIGFGKTAAHNLEIIRRLSDFQAFEKPLLLGHSRKSFIGTVLGGLTAAERFEGSAAAAAIGIFNGANIIRVHDVRETARVAGVADAIRRGLSWQ